MGMKIGELAHRTKVTRATIRYYERRELLPEPARTDSGYREYEQGAVKRLQFIKRAKRLGFSLTEIRELLSLRIETGDACEPIRGRAEEKAHEIEERVRELEAIKRTLYRLIASCNSGEPTSECPILEVLEDGLES